LILTIVRIGWLNLKRDRAAQEANVVHVEARRLTDHARLEARDATAVLAELDLLGVAGERGTGGVDVEIVARLLEVVD
jgi:hypothetical protein